jgi:hypothetical protein
MLRDEIIAVCSEIHKKTHNMNYIESSSSYRAVNTFRIGYKYRSLLLCNEIIAVRSQIQKKNTAWII